MNIYSFFNIIRRIKKNVKSYFLIILELIIATSVFLIFLTASFTIRHNYSKIIKSGGDLTYEIKINVSNDEIIDFMHTFDYLSWQEGKQLLNEYKVDKNCPITPDDMAYINEAYKYKIDISLYIVRYIVYIDPITFEPKKVFLIFADTDHNKSQTAAFIGDDFRKLFTKEYMNQITSKRDLIFESIKEKPNTIKTMNGYELELKNIELLDTNVIEQIKDILKSYGNQSFSESEILVCPSSLYFDFYHPKDNFSFSLFIKPKEAEYASTSLANVIFYLNSSHKGEYSYKIDNKANAYLQQMESARESSEVISFVSILSILVVILGMTGLMLLSFDKRKKEFAILISYGAAKASLVYEVVSESVIITITGGVLGLIVGSLICKSGIIIFYDYIVRFDYRMALASFILSILCGLVAVFPVIDKIYRLPPAEILRNL